MKASLSFILIIIVVMLLSVCSEKNGIINGGERTLTEEEHLEIERIRAFMSAELWDIIREYNISYGKIEGSPTILDLNRDDEIMVMLSSAETWFVLDFEYRLSALITIKEEESGISLYIDSITLHNITDCENMSITIPELLFPYVINAEP